jgi:ribosomal protein L35
MEGLTSKKTKEPPKRVNHKGNMKFQNPSCCKKHINKERERPRERMLRKTFAYYNNTVQNRDHLRMLTPSTYKIHAKIRKEDL